MPVYKVSMITTAPWIPRDNKLQIFVQCYCCTCKFRKSSIWLIVLTIIQITNGSVIEQWFRRKNRFYNFWQIREICLFTVDSGNHQWKALFRATTSRKGVSYMSYSTYLFVLKKPESLLAKAFSKKFDSFKLVRQWTHLNRMLLVIFIILVYYVDCFYRLMLHLMTVVQTQLYTSLSQLVMMAHLYLR